MLHTYFYYTVLANTEYTLCINKYLWQKKHELRMYAKAMIYHSTTSIKTYTVIRLSFANNVKHVINHLFLRSAISFNVDHTGLSEVLKTHSVV